MTENAEILDMLTLQISMVVPVADMSGCVQQREYYHRYIVSDIITS